MLKAFQTGFLSRSFQNIYNNAAIYNENTIHLYFNIGYQNTEIDIIEVDKLLSLT